MITDATRLRHAQQRMGGAIDHLRSALASLDQREKVEARIKSAIALLNSKHAALDAPLPRPDHEGP